MYVSFRTRTTVITATALLLAACGRAATAPVTRPSLVLDPINDFIPSFTGPHNTDLDVRTMEVSYDGTNFTFSGTMVGAIGQTTGGVYVWGVNRGAGTPRFGSIATGVLFDFVVIVRPGGTSSVRDFITTAATDLPPSSVTISGNTVMAVVPASLMPTQGLAPDLYTSNLWPRTGLASNAQISDFAPDNSNAPVRVIR